MADYDVGVLGLSSPPSSAVLTPYRPAAEVRNNGLHDAIASGYLRIYAAGILVFETELYSNTLSPGETGDAQAVDYWTPPAEGTYIVQGYVSCPLDQVEPNNNLYPTTIIVAGGPTPPPTPVEPHAPQHEEGGADEISIDGLPGRAADPQEPLSHAASHQAGGEDQVNVASLIGELASPQTPKAHGNAYHNPVMATASELSSHNSAIAAHSAAANLANRETSGPELGLVPWLQLASGSAVPAGDDNGLRSDRIFGRVKATNLGGNRGIGSILPGAGYSEIHALTIPAAWQDDNLYCIIRAFCHLTLENLGSLDVRLAYGAASWITFTIPGLSDTDRHAIITAHIYGAVTGIWSASLEYADDPQSSHAHLHRIEHKLAAVAYPASDKVFTLQAQLTSGTPGDMLTVLGAAALNLSAQP